MVALNLPARGRVDGSSIFYADDFHRLVDAADALNQGKLEPGTAAFAEAVQDIVAAMIVAGANIGRTYDDAAGTLTLTATAGGTGGTDPETVRDTIAAALRAGTGINIVADDAADTITITLALHGHVAADITAGIFSTARLGSGIASASTYLRGDSTWAALPASGAATVTRTPEDHGAVGNGTTDDQAALVAWLGALQPREVGRLGAGKTYAHSGKLTLAAADVTLECTGARLRATVAGAACFRIASTAARYRLVDFTHEVVGATTRIDTNFDSCPLLIDGAPGGELIRPRTSGSAGTGMFLYGPDGFRVVDPVVDRSFADGFHMTQGARNGIVIAPRINRAGDDGVAVVSYDADAVACSNITVVSPVVEHCHARGVSIVGGTDIRYYDLDVSFTRAAGAAIMAENGVNFKTKQNTRCTIRGGAVRHTNYPVSPAGDTGTTDAGLDQGALFLFNDRADAMTDCSITDVRVADVGPGSPFDATRAIVQNGGTFTGCAMRRITLLPGAPVVALGANGASQVAGVESFVDLRAGAVKTKLAADVPVATGTAVTLSWTGADEVDTAGQHSVSTNPTRLVAASSGVYQVQAFVSFAANPTGTRHVFMKQNGAGTDFLDEVRQAVTASGFATRISTGTLVRLSAGDYVEIGVFQSSGATLSIESALSSFSMFKVT